MRSWRRPRASCRRGGSCRKNHEAFVVPQGHRGVLRIVLNECGESRADARPGHDAQSASDASDCSIAALQHGIRATDGDEIVLEAAVERVEARDVRLVDAVRTGGDERVGGLNRGERHNTTVGNCEEEQHKRRLHVLVRHLFMLTTADVY